MRVYRHLVNSSVVIDLLRTGSSVCSVARMLRVSRTTVSASVKRAGFCVAELRPDRVNHDFFRVIDREDKAWCLGLLFADGCIARAKKPDGSYGRKWVQLRLKDRDAVEQYHTALDCRNNIATICNGTFQSAISSAQLVEDLERYGCVPAKSLIVRFPELPEEMVRHFVRGFFDGNGCASAHNKSTATPQLRYAFVSTLELLTELREVLRDVIGSSGYLCRQVKVAQLQYNGNLVCRRLADWMYQDASVWMRRKKETAFALLRLPL